jgi:uncharacterized membrane protein YphA (DoxX/SURF4 family)
METKKIILILRIIVAGIFFQTLFFKFTGAEESKYIFSTLGVEPWGRILSGCVELIAGVLILLPATQLLGALVGLGVISGAILSHLFVLGVVVQGDGGLLFALACAVFIGCSFIIYLQRGNLIHFLKGFKK